MSTRSHRHLCLSVLASAIILNGPSWGGDEAESWPQFRGRNGSGIAAPETDPPVLFGPDQHVAWKVSVPSGVSSACVWQERIFLTTFDKRNKQLQVLCLSREDGSLFWSQDVAAEKIERVHTISNPAYSTPATDGERVYVYFGSYGLLCYDRDGSLLWDVALPVPSRRFGCGTSPAVVGDLVVLNRGTTTAEQGDDYLLAFDRKTGKAVWTLPQSESDERRYPGYAMPVIWDEQLVIHREGGIDSYRVADGTRLWTIDIHSYGESTPVIGDNKLFVSAWANFGEPDLHVDPPAYQALLDDYDKDSDGKIHIDELPDEFSFELRPEVGDLPGGRIALKTVWGTIDKNNDRFMDIEDWNGVVGFVKSMTQEHGIVAVKPGGEGNITGTHILWKEKTKIPEVPSPLYYLGHLYTVKNGGIVSCQDAETGSVVYREKLDAGGPYYASPICASGRIYLISWKGIVSVLAAGDEFRVLTGNDLEDKVIATPAAVGGTLFVRTSEYLYAFSHQRQGKMDTNSTDRLWCDMKRGNRELYFYDL